MKLSLFHLALVIQKIALHGARYRYEIAGDVGVISKYSTPSHRSLLWQCLAFCQQLWASSPMNGPIHAASTETALVCSIHNGISLPVHRGSHELAPPTTRGDARHTACHSTLANTPLREVADGDGDHAWRTMHVKREPRV